MQRLGFQTRRGALRGRDARQDVRQDRQLWVVVQSALLVLPILAGCIWAPDYINPVEWYRGVSDEFRGLETDAAKTPPPPVPGMDAPFPKLGSVPEAPPRDDIVGEMTAIADEMETLRVNALFIDAVARGADGSGAAPEPRMVRIGFVGDSAEVPASARRAIAAFAKRVLRDDKTRAQIKAYASADETSDDPADAARRLSLARAAAVRTALVDHGVAITRVALRALGDTREDGPADRVDAILVE